VEARRGFNVATVAIANKKSPNSRAQHAHETAFRHD
jgi:hypothetical protein